MRATPLPLTRLLALRNLRADRFGTLAAILGVALGTAVVETVVVLDANTSRVEASRWSTNPGAPLPRGGLVLEGRTRAGSVVAPLDAKAETHEDYEVMRSAVRLGSLSAFLVGALIVFFTFAVVVERRRREVALLRSIGALPSQVSAVFVREAVMVGALGALLGLAMAVPLSLIAAFAGITTTGRAHISVWHLEFPRRRMLFVAAVGAITALLGVLRPAREVLRIDITRALRPRFLDETDRVARRRGVALLALPFALLTYMLMRPFFQSALPSLTFFVLEAALACVAFLATLMVVPDVVRVLGALAVRMIPGAPAAERLLGRRRVEMRGHELAWSVSGIMMVFALLMALHIATAALKQEVIHWADEALGDEVYFLRVDDPATPIEVVEPLPPAVKVARFSGTTPWPNPVRAVAPEELAALAEARHRPDLAVVARRLGRGKALLSTMMARRLRIGVGDSVRIGAGDQARWLEVVGVTDGIGFVPIRGPYRNAKTYATLSPDDFDLIAPFVPPPGLDLAFAGVTPYTVGQYMVARARVRGREGVYGPDFRRHRLRETDRDFAIFDFMLLLTSVLAAVGVANQLMLSLHGRRREIGLYRVLGMTTAQLRRLVLLEGAFVGLLGGALAALLGVPLGYAAIGALSAVSAFQVEFQLPLRLIPLVVFGSLGVALLASLYPARRVAGSGASESVHYE